MRAGLLYHYITIEEKHQTGTGDRGQPVYTWTTLYADVPAGIVPLDGRKLEIARQLVPTATHKVTLRYHDMAETNRIKFGDRIFNIGNILNTDELDYELVLLVTEEK